MKISLLSPDVSQNCMARAHLLYRMLSTVHEVEIVGPAFGGQVWEPLRGRDEVSIKVVPHASAREMARHADGDVLYAIKPRPTSLGVALEAGARPTARCWSTSTTGSRASCSTT